MIAQLRNEIDSPKALTPSLEKMIAHLRNEVESPNSL